MITAVNTTEQVIAIPLHQHLTLHKKDFSPVVTFNPKTDRLLHMNLTAANTRLNPEVVSDLNLFSAYINNTLINYKYGIGGYNELRTMYSRSGIFDADDEPRRLHLGTDIWGPAGTPITAPLAATVHSFAFNDHYGDYGATIILEHNLSGRQFYTLYGHLSLASIAALHKGQHIEAGQVFAYFGAPNDNGHWPPHLHFQVIENMGTASGDYPGVCKASEKEIYLNNCPDANLVLQMMQFGETHIL